MKTEVNHLLMKSLMLETWQLTEIKKGPEAVRKAKEMKRIKIIKEQERKMKEEERRKRREKVTSST